MRSNKLIITYLPGLCVAAVALPAFAEEGNIIEIEKGTDYSNNDNWSIKCEDIKHDVDVFMPGQTFTDEDIKKIGLKLSTTPNQTGGLITWNTIGPGGKSPTVGKGARCVNPLSWTTDTAEYPASMNKGAKILLTDGKEVVIDNFTSARINNDGALEIPVPKPEIAEKLDMSLGEQCYHHYDYDFFFYNIVDNVAHRCQAYSKNHKSD